jgi:hypothetical protein
MTVHIRRRTLVAAVATVALLAAGGIAYATIPDSAGVIHGCYQQATGALRVIDSATESCRSTEAALSWNQTGPPGPQGPAGPAGPQGSPGLSGYEVVTQNTATDTSPYKLLTVYCPPGKTLIGGGGATFFAWAPGPGAPTPALASSFAYNGGWYAEAFSTVNQNWYLQVQANCAYVN